MEQEQQRIKKSLIEYEEYGRLLYIIGKSRKPLPSTRIEKEYLNTKSLRSTKYVYKMLKELCPTEYVIDDFLFVWEDITENYDNGEYKGKLIKKFNEAFELKWPIEDAWAKEDTDMKNDHLIRFDLIKNSDKSEQLNIHHDKRNMITIYLDPKKE